MTHQITKADRTAWQGLLIQAPQHIKQCLLSLHHHPAQLQAQACPILEGIPVGTDMRIIIGNSTCHHLYLSQTYAWVKESRNGRRSVSGALTFKQNKAASIELEKASMNSLSPSCTASGYVN